VIHPGDDFISTFVIVKIVLDYIKLAMAEIFETFCAFNFILQLTKAINCMQFLYINYLHCLTY